MDVMMRLPSSSLDILRTKFRESGNGKGLNLDQFVNVMLTYLPPCPSRSDEVKLVMELVELFTQIDVNGDATLEWDEFTSHCIEAGMLATRKVVKPLSEVYRRNEDFVDPISNHVVLQMKYVEAQGAIIVVQANSATVTILDAATLKVSRLLQVYKPGDDDHSPCFYAEYIPDLHLIAVCCCNLTMSFYTWDDFRFLSRTKIKNIRKMYYASNKMLYTTDDAGLTLMWQLRIKLFSGRYQCICIPRGMLPGHTAFVNAFTEAKRYNLLCTGGMDANIFLWDMESNTSVGNLQKHKRAVCFLEYADKQDLLLSAGYEAEIFGWDLTNRQVVMEFKGHATPCIGLQLTSLHAEDDSQYGVSCDSEGIMKLWKLNRVPNGEVQAHQTFFADPEVNIYKPRLISSCGPRRILASSREVRLYEAVTTYVQDYLPNHAILNLVLDRFYVALGSYLQTYCAITGDLLEEWYYLSQTEISAICFDARKRKVILGNIGGEVIVVNALNGAIMKTARIPVAEDLESTFAKSRDPAVVGLHYNDSDKILIVVGCHTIAIYDEDLVDEKAEGHYLPRFRIAYDTHEKAVLSSAFSFELSLIATGSTDKTIRLWDFQQLRLEGECYGHEGEITSLRFVPNHPILVAADSKCEIFMWSVRPHPYPYMCLTRSLNRSVYARSTEGAMVNLGAILRRQTVAASDESHNGQLEDILRKRKDGGKRRKNRRLTLAATITEKRKEIVDAQKFEDVPVKQILINLDDNGNLMLFTGDKRGDVKEWDLRQCLDELQIDAIPMNRQPPFLEGYNPTRTVEISYNYLFEESEDVVMPTAMPSSGKGVVDEEEIRKQMAEIRNRKRKQEKMREQLKRSRQNKASVNAKTTAKLHPVHMFYAHGDELNSLQFFDNPKGFLTSSTDGNVRIWDVSGKRVGNLTLSENEVRDIQHGRLKAVPFTFKIEIEAKKRRKHEFAEELLAKVKPENKLVELPQIVKQKTERKVVSPSSINTNNKSKQPSKMTVSPRSPLNQKRLEQALASVAASCGNDSDEAACLDEETGGLNGSEPKEVEERVAPSPILVVGEKQVEFLDKSIDYMLQGKEVNFSPLRNSYESLYRENLKRYEKAIRKAKRFEVDTTPSPLLESALQEARKPRTQKQGKQALDSLNTTSFSSIGSHFNKKYNIASPTKKHCQSLPNLPTLGEIKSHSNNRNDDQQQQQPRQEGDGRRETMLIPRAKRRQSVQDRIPTRMTRSYSYKSTLRRDGSMFIRNLRELVTDDDREDESKQITPRTRERSKTKVDHILGGGLDNEEAEDGLGPLKSLDASLDRPPRLSVIERTFLNKRYNKKSTHMSRATQISLQRRIDCPEDSKRWEDMPSHSGAVGFVSKHNIGIYSKKEILNLKIIFDQIDADGSGKVDLEELMDNLDKLSVDLEVLSGMFDIIDDDHSGEITFGEMLALFMPAATQKEHRKMLDFVTDKAQNINTRKELAPLTEKDKKELGELFRYYDADGGGTLSLAELFEALNKVEYKPKDQFQNDDELIFTFEDIERITKKHGFDMDHELTEEDFVNLMHEFLSMDVEIM